MATTAEPRPLRADARRNREAILKAARRVFARDGTDAQMDDVARRAGVGVGTVYRHFPTKEALLDALVADRVTQLAGFLAEALEEEDAFLGLCTALRRGAELASRDRATTELFTRRGPQVAGAPFDEMRDRTDELVRRARDAGQVRPDLRGSDIGVLMCGVVHSMHKTRDPDGWRRLLQIALDGMSTETARGALPG
jgi:AcrR family transcriptional regulator